MRSTTISSRQKTRHSCSSTTRPLSWPRSARWIPGSCSRTRSRPSGPSRPSESRSCTRPSTSPTARGPTLPELAVLLADDMPLDRTTVNSWEDIEFVQAVRATGRRKLVICALWTEVCMAFTALDALRDGYEVYPSSTRSPAPRPRPTGPALIAWSRLKRSRGALQPERVGSAGRSGESPRSGDDLSPSRRPPLAVVRIRAGARGDPVALLEGRGKWSRNELAGI